MIKKNDALRLAYDRIITRLDQETQDLVYKRNRNKRDINRLASEQRIIKKELTKLYEMKKELVEEKEKVTGGK